MSPIAIELMNPELLLKVLAQIDSLSIPGNDPDDEQCHRVLDDLTLKIQQGLHFKAENTWKHLSSFERFYAEINEFGDVRINDKVFKPEYSRVYDGWITLFPDNKGNPVPIDPVHFVKVYYDKELVLD